MQLLAKNQRSGRAKGALKEVQDRAKELAKIEETLIGLGQLFNDVSHIILLIPEQVSDRIDLDGAVG